MMGRVKIANETDTGSTAISNLFIDEYMGTANDAQIKVYLYLLRMMQSGTPTSVSAIADKFNHTEKEVIRAISFWEQHGLVHCEYDDNGNMTHICLDDLKAAAHSLAQTPVSRSVPAPEAPLSTGAHTGADGTSADKPARKNYTAAQLKSFSDDPDLQMALFAAETYFRRALKSSEMQLIVYIFDELRFSPALIDYLLQYTAENARGPVAPYMEATALAWHSEGVRSVEDARRSAGGGKQVYDIMRMLGLSNAPTAFENGYIGRWLSEYGFPMEVIEEACARTVKNTQTHRIEYADGILRNWFSQGVTAPEDIARAEEKHDQARAAKASPAGDTAGSQKTDKRNRFNRFRQNDYDMEEIRKKVVTNY